MREEIALKTAILAEKFAPDAAWYADVALALLERAGDHCGDDVWRRAVQLVTNNPSMQAHAATKVCARVCVGLLVCARVEIESGCGRMAVYLGIH